MVSNGHCGSENMKCFCSLECSEGRADWFKLSSDFPQLAELIAFLGPQPVLMYRTISQVLPNPH